MPSALLQPIYKNTIRYTGDVGVPWEIQRRRKQTMETMRRMGTPVLLKHQYNTDDVDKGVAQISPNFDTVYMQSVHDDPLSYGIGYTSVETTHGEWINPETRELEITDNPEEGWIAAPTYRGYGPGYLTYVILPDAPEDVFKHTEEGALLHTQQAIVQLPWWPVSGDNDLLIVCEIDATEKIVETFERYQLKKVSPITMRGKDRWGRREVQSVAAGNRFWVGQRCEASKALETDPIYEVEVDR